MGEIIKEYVVPIGVFSTLLATFFNIYYTRKNLKTSKYIDVVTTERIKWLSIIRSEVSELISIISETLIIFNNEIESIESQNLSEDYVNSQNHSYQIHSLDALTKNALVIKDKVDYRELNTKLNLLKLRFNPHEDVTIISKINYFIAFYKNEYTESKDVDKANLELQLLVENIQKMLKNEWEKIKKESRGN